QGQGQGLDQGQGQGLDQGQGQGLDQGQGQGLDQGQGQGLDQGQTFLPGQGFVDTFFKDEEGERFQEHTGRQTQLGQVDILETLITGDNQTPDACLLRQDPGGCQNYSMKWFFDRLQKECARFWYGGCGGNNNRFETRVECEKMCATKNR
ncbi:tissue factor pathway inhibitor, partial [Nematolebias whitei]|uniref:tissue factor pathway inhibitor n=1 Tax=Nematolebias whitei TaxID=451745 RepID=UPI00189BD038